MRYPTHPIEIGGLASLRSCVKKTSQGSNSIHPMPRSKRSARTFGSKKTITYPCRTSQAVAFDLVRKRQSLEYDSGLCWDTDGVSRLMTARETKMFVAHDAHTYLSGSPYYDTTPLARHCLDPCVNDTSHIFAQNGIPFVCHVIKKLQHCLSQCD